MVGPIEQGTYQTDRVQCILGMLHSLRCLLLALQVCREGMLNMKRIQKCWPRFCKDTMDLSSVCQRSAHVVMS